MWKVVCATHEMYYPNFEFQEETLKKVTGNIMGIENKNIK
jgi:hypothetical protein